MKNNILRWLLACAMLACLCACMPPAQAQDSDGWKGQNDRDIVNIDHNSLLPAGETAEDVVAVMGNSEVDGDVSDSAVAVMGNVTVNGTVGSGGAVAVLGNAYINGKVDGDVVAVLGNVILGPQAVISGEVTEVMGTVQRSPTAVITGGTVGVLSGIFGNVEGLHAWVRECLLFGRPLAPSVAVAWAWWLALAALAFYILIAVLFQGGLRRCVQTLEMHPGPSVLAAIIATLLMPVVVVALCITVIGIAVIPILWFALFCAGIFGRVVAIAWLGGRCLRLASPHSASRAALEVLVGGLLVLALYMVPVLGFLLSLLLGVFGFGAVMYTLLLAARPAHPKPMAGGGGGPATQGAPGGDPATGEHPAGTAGAAVPPPSWTASTATGSAFSESAAAGSPPPPPPPPPAAPAGHAAHVLDVATLPRAGFWIRMLALLIDLILVGVALSWLHHGGRGMLLMLATYGAIMWKLKGTTVGGIVCDLKVVRIGGGPLDWGTAIVRALGCFLSLVVCGLGFIWIAVDHDHQAWHDKIAGTVVVRVPKGVGLV
ncbi:MAG TPA: RDD family protein [Steroidobacteraceae bacterium]